MRRGLQPVVLAAASLVIGATAGGATLDARPLGRLQRTSDERARSVEVLELRTALERAHLDEADTFLLEDVFGVGSASRLAAARDERARVRRSATARLTRIAEGPDAAGREAFGLLNVLGTDGVGRSRVVQPDLLAVPADFDVYLRPNVHRNEPADLRRLRELDAVSSVGAWTVQAALVRLIVSPGSTARSRRVDLAAFRSFESDITIGGFLSYDRRHPLIGSTYAITARRPSALSRNLAAIDREVAASPVAGYDRWLSEHGDDLAARPPASLGDLWAEATALDRVIRSRVDRALRTARTEAEADARAANRDHDRWRIVAGLLAALAVAVGATAIAIVVVRARSHERMATTDPLTGAGNRRHLDDVVAERLADPDLRWHLFAAIDLDRFKLINDTWGHPFGDAVLVRLAQELRGVIAEVRHAHTGVEGALVRLGGDEFLVAIHAPRPFDAAEVAALLDRARSIELHTNDGQPVRLHFSYGVATTDDASNVDDLLAAADLASYEEKAARSQPSVDQPA